MLVPWPFQKFFQKNEKLKTDANIIDIDEELAMESDVIEYEENYNLLSNKIAYKIVCVIDSICPCLLCDSV